MNWEGWTAGSGQSIQSYILISDSSTVSAERILMSMLQWGLLIKCRKDKKVNATQSEWHPASRWCTAIPGLVTKGLGMMHHHTRFGYKRPRNDAPPYQVWLQKASRWCTAIPGLVTKGLGMMHHHTRFGYKRPQDAQYHVWLQEASRWCTVIPGLVTKGLKIMHHHTRFGYKRPQDDAPPYQVWLQKASEWCTTIPGLVTNGLRMMHHHTRSGYKRQSALEDIFWTKPGHTDKTDGKTDI